MAELQWEYCQLWLGHSEEVSPGLRERFVPGMNYSSSDKVSGNG